MCMKPEQIQCPRDDSVFCAGEKTDIWYVQFSGIETWSPDWLTFSTHLRAKINYFIKHIPRFSVEIFWTWTICAPDHQNSFVTIIFLQIMAEFFGKIEWLLHYNDFHKTIDCMQVITDFFPVKQ